MHAPSPHTPTILRACVALSLLLALHLTPAARAQTTTLLDTFGPGNGFSGSGAVAGTSSTLNAVRFVVPASGNVSLVSIDMALAITGSVSTAQIGIFNDSNFGLPVGMPIAFANIPGPLTGTLTFTSSPFPAGTTLTAGRIYWVAPVITGAGSIIWGSGLTGATTVAFYNGSSWARQTPPNPLAIRITVATAATPCCNARGTGCIMLLPADCATIGGVVVIDQQTCEHTLCDVFVNGACCRGTSCRQDTFVGCAFTSPPGRFLGQGIACTPLVPGAPNPCCPADFNNSGAATVQDLFDFLTAWFAACP